MCASSCGGVTCQKNYILYGARRLYVRMRLALASLTKRSFFGSKVTLRPSFQLIAAAKQAMWP